MFSLDILLQSCYNAFVYVFFPIALPFHGLYFFHVLYERVISVKNDILSFINAIKKKKISGVRQMTAPI